ncbi:MAG TPA: hypothetical protein VER96_06730 [Polyangiaceae bacterium]|nr:hypothetical protein [Polyangiaceae bacterium]
MTDSERPNQTPQFEVPDLELEPVPRSIRQAAPTRAPNPSPLPAAAPVTTDLMFGATFDFGDELGDFELERTAQPNAQLATEPAPSAPVSGTVKRAPQAQPSVTTWRAPETAQLVFDPRELAILADYGDPPNNAALTIAYAYRVFARRRVLQRQLAPISAESAQAESERDASLAELARTLRPEIEQISEFRRFLAPVLEGELRAAARGQALNSINAQLGAHNAELDAEQAQVENQIQTAQRMESEAQRQCDEREENAERAQAKFKRAQIEMRGVTDPTQLGELEQRARALQPEALAAQSAFEHARQTLQQVRAGLETLRQNERKIARKRQAVGGAFQKEISARAEGLSEVELEQRSALAELARAVLAAPGAIAIPEASLERARSARERADPLFVRAEMFRRAIASYDAARARQGTRLAFTALGLTLVLISFKLIF